jgi:hypothetical protein
VVVVLVLVNTELLRASVITIVILGLNVLVLTEVLAATVVTLVILGFNVFTSTNDRFTA